jgi:pimeloyl-ACP methyl ester carboxylesterase
VRDARCGTLEVWEDRAAQSGRKIGLRVAVIPAIDRFPEPDPLFILAGGPGQAATEVGPLMLGALDRIHRERDIVLVDQRGTGSSNPLDCQPEDESPAGELRELFRVDLPVDRLADCRAGYDADPALYTTPIAMDDLDEVRAWLGYERVNVWGGSYGTRAALVYLRRHPDHVRTVVLDGVAPVSMKLPLFMARDGQRALDRVFADCEADPACQQAHPRLGERLAELLEKLERTPARVNLEHPRTGEPVSVEIQRDAVAGIMRGALYAPETAALVPTVIERAREGDFQPLAALALTGALSDTMSIGMFLSVVCAEDIPQLEEGEGARATAGTFLGSAMLDSVVEACAQWPTGTVPDGYADPVSSDAPVLVLSGELDPATPPEWGERAAETLTNAEHVIVPGIAHGAWNRGCVPRLMAEFVAAGTAEGLDTSCTQRLHRPPFFVDFAGPPP